MLNRQEISLKSQIRAIDKENKKTSKKVNRRVENSSIFGMITRNFVKIFILLFFGSLIIFPFYYMITSSLMSYEEITNDSSLGIDALPILWPSIFQWHNYVDAFKNGYFQALWFSTSVVIFSLLFKISVCLLLGYAFGRFEFKGKKVLWFLFMLTLMVPEVALMSGQYKICINNFGFDGLGLYISLAGPYIASIFTAYLFRNGFEAIDDSVKEAALIDGIGGVRFFFIIAIPMIAPIIWTQVILGALASWNSYIWPSLILAMSGDHKTIPLWLFEVGKLNADGTENIHGTAIRVAGSVLAILPTMIFYFIFKRRINASLTGSANKG